MTGTSLFVLVGEYRAAADRLAEIELPPEVLVDTLDSLTGPVEEKCTALAHVTLNFEVAADAIENYAGEQIKRAKAMRKRADALRAYIADGMTAAGLQKIQGPTGRLSFRASSAVVIDGVNLLPAEYMRVPEPPPPAPDKIKIAAALKSGQAIPGAHIETRKHLRIEP